MARKRSSRSRRPVTARGFLQREGFSAQDLDDLSEASEASNKRFWDRVFAKQADEVGADFEEYRSTVQRLQDAKIGAKVSIQGHEFVKQDNRMTGEAWIGPYYSEDDDEWRDTLVAHTSVTLAMLFFRRRL